MHPYAVNWTTERDLLDSFLESNLKIIHVTGSANCSPGIFTNVAIALAESFHRPFKTCVIDPKNIATSTPHGALLSIIGRLGLLDSLESEWNSGLGNFDVLSDIRARRVEMSNVHIKVNQPTRSESQEMASLVRFMETQIDKGLRFDNLLLIFAQSHQMKKRLRRTFFSSLWEPLLHSMLERGAKALFQYSIDDCEMEDYSIPPQADLCIELPRQFDQSVATEISSLSAERGWEESGGSSDVLARTVLLSCSTVSEVHASLAKIALGQTEAVNR